ncbi:MAG: HIT family protein [Patescibacteria group bacterium]
MTSVFSKIINKELPAYIVDENESYIAILARGQVQPGHTLIIPKQHIDKYTDMDETAFAEIQKYALTIAKKLKNVFHEKERIIMNIVGFEVPHLHIHLVPANNIEEGYAQGVVLDDEGMQHILKRILNH